MKITSFLRRLCAVFTVVGFIVTGAVVLDSPTASYAVEVDPFAIPESAFMQPKNLFPKAGHRVSDAMPESDVSFESISTGDEHSLGIDQEGAVWAWGTNRRCQLGVSQEVRSDSSAPLRVDLGEGKKAVSVSAGYNTSFAIDEEGAVWAWGDNASVKLGIGESLADCVPTPTKIQGFRLENGTISSSSNFTLALNDEGKLYVWGSNHKNELGDIAPGVLYQATPVHIYQNKTFTSADAGSGHGVAVTNDGMVVTWGSDSSAQLTGEQVDGRGSSRDLLEPLSAVTLQDGESFVDVAAGTSHSLVRTSFGRVYSWGYNSRGQLGIGDKDSSYSVATEVQLGENVSATSIHAGSSFSGAVLHELGDDGSGAQLSLWGYNYYGQIGVGSDLVEKYTTPQIVKLPDSAVLSTVSLGGAHVFVNATVEHVPGSFHQPAFSSPFAWGKADSGQLASNTRINILVPKKTMEPELVRAYYENNEQSEQNLETEVLGDRWFIKEVPSPDELVGKHISVVFKTHGEGKTVERFISFADFGDMEVSFEASEGDRFADGSHQHISTLTFFTKETIEGVKSPVIFTDLGVLKDVVDLNFAGEKTGSKYVLSEFVANEPGSYSVYGTSRDVDVYTITSDSTFGDIKTAVNGSHEFVETFNDERSWLEIDDGQRFADGKHVYDVKAMIYKSDGFTAYGGLTPELLEYALGLVFLDADDKPADFKLHFRENATTSGMYTAQAVSDIVAKYTVRSKLVPPSGEDRDNRELDFITLVDLEASQITFTTENDFIPADGSTPHIFEVQLKDADKQQPYAGLSQNLFLHAVVKSMRTNNSNATGSISVLEQEEGVYNFAVFFLSDDIELDKLRLTFDTHLRANGSIISFEMQYKPVNR